MGMEALNQAVEMKIMRVGRFLLNDLSKGLTFIIFKKDKNSQTKKAKLIQS